MPSQITTSTHILAYAQKGSAASFVNIKKSLGSGNFFLHTLLLKKQLFFVPLIQSWTYNIQFGKSSDEWSTTQLLFLYIVPLK